MFNFGLKEKEKVSTNRVVQKTHQGNFKSPQPQTPPPKPSNRKISESTKTFLSKHMFIGWIGLFICLCVIAGFIFVGYNIIGSVKQDFIELKLETDNLVGTWKNSLDDSFDYYKSLQREEGAATAFRLFGQNAIETFYRNRPPFGNSRRLTNSEIATVLDLIWNLSRNDNFVLSDPTLALAYMIVESGFGPTAVSHAGAMGLFQFMPFTADAMMREYFPNEYDERMRRNILHNPRNSILFDPVWSTRLFFAHYDYLFRIHDHAFGNSDYAIEYIALAYNGGPNRDTMVRFARDNRHPDQFVATGLWRGDGNSYRYDRLIRQWYDRYRHAWDERRVSMLEEFNYREIEILILFDVE